MLVMKRLRSRMLFLYSDLLIWTRAPSEGECSADMTSGSGPIIIKGWLALCGSVLVSVDKRDNRVVVITTPDLPELGFASSTVRFVCDTPAQCQIWLFYISAVLRQLPLRPRAPPPAPKHKGSKKFDEFHYSQPFNVKHRTHITKNLEWLGERDVEETLQLVEKIGSGGFGDVYKAVYRETGFALAVKLVNSRNAALSKEIDILKMCVHPNIVVCYGCGGPDRQGRAWIILDFCGGM